LPGAFVWQVGARIEAAPEQVLFGHFQKTFEAKHFVDQYDPIPERSIAVFAIEIITNKFKKI
jgi:hypothetical protein